jgi:hypothetical protein
MLSRAHIVGEGCSGDGTDLDMGLLVLGDPDVLWVVEEGRVRVRLHDIRTSHRCGKARTVRVRCPSRRVSALRDRQGNQGELESGQGELNLLSATILDSFPPVSRARLACRREPWILDRYG